MSEHKGHAPPFFDRSSLRGWLIVLVAIAFFVAGYFREQQVATPFEPLALVLRVLAMGAALRSLFVFGDLFARLKLARGAAEQTLALSDESLTWKRESDTLVIAREDIVSIMQCGHWARRASDRYGDVYVIMRPSAGQVLVRIPPIFEETPTLLAERLMRWRGAPPDREQELEAPAPNKLASKVYDRASRGQLDEGVAVIPHGRGWLRRGPYAALLFAAVVFDALFRMPEEWEMGSLGVVLIVVCLGVPLGWYFLSRRHVAPRKGLALVLTPSELLIRVRAGIVRAQWQHLTGVASEERGSWSVLEGYTRSQVVRIDREDAPPIRYDEAFLGFPADVAIALLTSYQRGELP